MESFINFVMIIPPHITNIIIITGNDSFGNNNPNVPMDNIPIISGKVTSCERIQTANKYNPQTIRKIQNPNTCINGAIKPVANPYTLKFPVAVKFCNQYFRNVEFCKSTAAFDLNWNVVLIPPGNTAVGAGIVGGTNTGPTVIYFIFVSVPVFRLFPTTRRTE
jgi:hypothetical protein